MAWRKAPQKLIDLFCETMDRYQSADRKKLFGYPCCYANGNMFTGLHQENWVVRLPEADRSLIKEHYDVSPFEPMAGRVMHEYVILPKKVVDDPKMLNEWIEKSLNFALSLPPKC